MLPYLQSQKEVELKGQTTGVDRLDEPLDEKEKPVKLRPW